MTRDEDARTMLAEIEAAKADLAERARAPVWYHPTLGLLAGGMVAIQGQPSTLKVAYTGLFVLGVALLVRAYKRHTGLWVGGFRAGRTRWVAIGMAVLIALCGFLALWLARHRGMSEAPLVFGAIIAAIVTVAGHVWEAAFRADLRDGGSL
ncbi:hypothetical protein [uncultured Caulobacter sp.]|uniref:hypothetical protein n=1 Tax=uncultured Caulobacter sp. TaxID=158749 RepID=UPI002609293E|nr:hypothetical protein [uncultured Caulobacter sp.]